MKVNDVVKCIDRKRPNEYGLFFRIYKKDGERCFLANMDGKPIMTIMDEPFHMYTYQLKIAQKKKK